MLPMLLSLLSYIKYVGENDVEERMLFCLALPGKTTGECPIDAMITKTEYFNLAWEQFTAICTNGAAAMTGKNVGFVKRILEIALDSK